MLPIYSCFVPLPNGRKVMAQFGIALVTLVSMTFTVIPPALAGETLLCRTIEGHEVCVMSIRRSAKNFWEYRVELRVDGQIRPTERYDCRRALRPLPNQKQPSPQALHELVCSLTQR